uniref:Uncharacterized protein n=1 Tax=Lates calcarifer TaxID=8187 RepID=A0A4W6CDB1_LATCA
MVKINRKKFDILGRKTKHDVGLPGVSRSKAINKRKETLLKESNKFIERRFGEYDTKMAPKDKILQRFAMERQVSDVVMYLYYCKQDSGLEQDTLAEPAGHKDSRTPVSGPVCRDRGRTHLYPGQSVNSAH